MATSLLLNRHGEPEDVLQLAKQPLGSLGPDDVSIDILMVRAVVMGIEHTFGTDQLTHSGSHQPV
jgi:NADPH:quinone reductase-like Zn-dependent oxidoreductase